MQLIGMMDSPYVRRVAISLDMLELPFEHRALSVFRHYEQFEHMNPAVKAPTLIDDDGTLLVDSSLILDVLDARVEPSRRLLPVDLAARRAALHVIGFALIAAEKTVQIVYEKDLRPAERRHEPWLERVRKQMNAAWSVVETALAPAGDGWLGGAQPLQADITAAVAWRFAQHMLPDFIEAGRYPVLEAFSARAEALPAFVARPLE